jgi:dolichyl-phosphate-mannose--protein O-mannosyl transferase
MAPTTDALLTSAILALSVLTRVAMIEYPREVVFDEYHFGKFVNGYLRGEYFFDIHPPLGKQVLTLFAWLGGYAAEQAWAQIAEPIPASVNLYALRIGPALQGAALPPLLFLAGRAFGLSQPAATLAAAGALFDTCMLVEQRLVLTDATLLLGITLQLGACAAADWHPSLSRAWLARLAVAGVGISLAVSTKMTGFATVAVAGVHSLIALYRARHHGASWRLLLLEAVARGVLLLLLPLLVYVGSFVLHLALLPSTGPGVKFMTKAFRASLRGDVYADVYAAAAAAAAAPSTARETIESADMATAMATAMASLAPTTAPSMASALVNASAPVTAPLGLMDRIIELSREMVRANAAIKKTHQWGSRWWEWPLMLRSVLYWRGKHAPYASHEGISPRPPDALEARIYCIGTPIVWWLCAAAPCLFLIWVLARSACPHRLPPYLRRIPAPDGAAASEGEAAAAHAAANGSEAPETALPNRKAVPDTALDGAPSAAAPSSVDGAAGAAAAPTADAPVSMPPGAPAPGAPPTLSAPPSPPPPPPLPPPLGPMSLLSTGWLLLLGYALNWLPFILVERVAFLYHFLPSLLHALLLLGLVLDVAVPPISLLFGRMPIQSAHVAHGPDEPPPLGTEAAHAANGRRWLLSGFFVYAMGGCFAFFAPIAYGVPLTKDEFDSRIWVSSWR